MSDGLHRLIALIPWTGTLPELAGQVAAQLRELSLPWPAPSIRTLRLWRTRGVFSAAPGQQVCGRQILEALAVLALQDKRWSLAAIADTLGTLDDQTLARRVADGAASNWDKSVPPVATSLSRLVGLAGIAEDTTVLLAQGILRCYARVLPGRSIVRQDDSLPPQLHAAMCRLGRLYIEEGRPDRAACVHDVLDRARYPLGSPTWALAAFSADSFPYATAVLIDPDLRVPTADCVSIAQCRGVGEDDVVENRLHALLREAADRLGPNRHRAYTAIREFVGRRSLATEDELRCWFSARGLAAVRPVMDELYDPVPDVWTISGRAHRCACCGTLLRPHPDRRSYPNGSCPIKQCSGKRDARVSDRLDARRAFVCKPQVLAYWVGPAIDELAVYDAAVAAGRDVELYPEGDRCDVSIGGDRIGIDVKSYSSPVTLARALNRDIGGLIGWRRRIVAVGDELAERSGYLDTLRASIDPCTAAGTLEIRSVSAVIAEMREATCA